MTDVDDFIAHFGRKGMKWGVVNDDAPSSSSGSGGTATKTKGKPAKSPEESAKREVKAQKFEKKAVELQTAKVQAEKNLANTHKINVYSKSIYKGQVKELDKQIASAEKDAAASREGRMSSRQKKLLIGAAIGGTIIAAYGTKYAVQSGSLTSASTRGKSFLNGGEGYFKKNNSLANKNYSAEDIMKHVVPGINPRYGEWGTNMNCRRATFAYEMRRRGYDVEATRTSNASGQTIFGVMNATNDGAKGLFAKVEAAEKNYNDGLAKVKLPSSPREIFKRLESEPDASRGEFAVMWRGSQPGIPGGGHSMAYEIIKGKAHIFDTQTGEEYKEDHDMFFNVMSSGFTRLDDKKLNEKFLTKWVR